MNDFPLFNSPLKGLKYRLRQILSFLSGFMLSYLTVEVASGGFSAWMLLITLSLTAFTLYWRLRHTTRLRTSIKGAALLLSTTTFGSLVLYLLTIVPKDLVFWSLMSYLVWGWLALGLGLYAFKGIGEMDDADKYHVSFGHD